MPQNQIGHFFAREYLIGYFKSDDVICAPGHCPPLVFGEAVNFSSETVRAPFDWKLEWPAKEHDKHMIFLVPQRLISTISWRCLKRIGFAVIEPRSLRPQETGWEF